MARNYSAGRCPLLTAQNAQMMTRMSKCYGPECMWWCPASEDKQIGDCAMMKIANALSGLNKTASDDGDTPRRYE